MTEVEGELRTRVERRLCWHLSGALFLWKEAQRGRERGKRDEIKKRKRCGVDDFASLRVFVMF